MMFSWNSEEDCNFLNLSKCDTNIKIGKDLRVMGGDLNYKGICLTE